MQGKKLKYFGHMIRQNYALQRTVLDGKVNGKRGRGRPRTKWTSNIEKCSGMKYHWHQAVLKAGARSKQVENHIASNPHQEDGTQ